MGTPQIAFLILAGMALGIAVAKHGEPREPYNGPAALLNAAASLALLWWGGFFS